MKKLYASLAALAAAALVTVSAAIPEALDTKKEPRIHSLDMPFGTISQKTLDQFNSLATTESYSGPKKNMLRASKEDFLGKYVNLTTSKWNDNVDGIESSEVEFKEVDGEIIAIDLFGLSGYVFTIPKGGPVATITEDGKLSVKSQKIGYWTYEGKTMDILICGYEPADQEGYININTDFELLYTMDANGNMTSNLTPDYGCIILVDDDTYGGVAIMASTSKIIKPNGTIAYKNTKQGEINKNVYVEQQEVDGFKVLFLSNVDLSGGYGVNFDLEEDEDGNLLPDAYAVNQITQDANETYYPGYGAWYLATVPVTEAGQIDLNEISKTVEATLSNNNSTLTFNDTWSCCNFSTTDGSIGYWQNLNTAAVVNFTLPGAGVEDNIIAVDNSNAPVEYYNLQGIRISEPAAGSVVIRRQGTEASKILVK